ncbi:MAG: hypothetical protein J6U66_06045 [Lachnospiraceae bacterium]|nr:hypothetical protein [Lachnospiraceae bacterium]
MSIRLYVYAKEDKKKVEKTYEVEGYDLMLGTVEEFMRIIDVDKLTDKMEVAKMLAKGYGQVKPLLSDVFPEITDEELNRTKVTELVETFIQIGMAVGDSLKELGSGNARRA